MDLFMLLFAIGWGVAFFVAGAFAGVIYVRLSANREPDTDWEAWAEGRWRDAETLLEHLLEVSQATATELSSHRDRFESAVESLSEAAADRDGREAATSEAVAERTQRLEQRLEQVFEMLEADSRRQTAEADRAEADSGEADRAEADSGAGHHEAGGGAGRDDAASDNLPPSSDAQVRERLEGANGNPKHLGRRQPRVSFEEMHDVAPILAGNDLPKREDFLSVHCRDISSAGFSFYFPGEVPWKAIVLRTCHNGIVREITADVVHCSRTSKPAAPAPYIIGCRFTGPLKRPAAKTGSEQSAAKAGKSGAAIAL